MFSWTSTSLILDSDELNKGKLYLGGYQSAQNYKDQQITAVLTAIWQSDIRFPQDVNHLIIHVNDDPECDLLKSFNESIKFIEDNLLTRNVLVHCAAGVSRSVTLVAAYLMKRRKQSPKQILDFIVSKRSCAGPNPGFRKQLDEYYKQIN